MAEKPEIIVFSTAYAPFIGGAELAIREIARRLSDAYAFTIVTARSRSDLVSTEVVPEGRIVRIGWGGRFDKLLLPFFGFFAVRKMIKNKKNILFWGMMISHASLAAYALKLLYKHIPFVLTLQEGDREWERMPSSLFWPAVLGRADEVTVISNFLSALARAKGYRKNISVIPNGVPEHLLEIAHNEHEVPIIFSASRLVRKNGMDILLRACARLKDVHSFHVIIAGDGPERRSLEMLAQHLGMSDRVRFLGSVPYEKLGDWYQKADIFARPSRSEGLGSAFLEAMAASLITVGTSVGGISDFLKDKDTGFVARPDDVDSMASALRKALILPEHERAHMIQKAKASVANRFLWKDIALRMGSVFARSIKNI